MQKVLVTGATGFIGNWVVEELLKQNVNVIATSTNTEKAKQFPWFGKVDYVPFDLKRFLPTENYFDFFHQPSHLIHLAWEGLPNYNFILKKICRGILHFFKTWRKMVYTI